MANHYQDLSVWQKAMDLVTEVYRVSARFPRNEVYGLTNQVRRAAVSIPSNIAEGQGRHTAGEFIQFLGHARGSVFEVETQLLIATRLEYVNMDQMRPLLDAAAEVSRMLNGLIASLTRGS